MNEDPRIGLIRRAFADFERRNVQALADFLHPEVESHVSPSQMNTGTWHGLPGFVEMNRAWEEPFEYIRYEIRDIDLVDERNVLVDVHQEAAGAASGVPVEADVVFLIEFEGERAIRFHVYAARDEALAAV